MAENVGAAEVLPQIAQIITDGRVRRPPTESTDFRSKKCTVSLVGAAETAAPPEKCASTD